MYILTFVFNDIIRKTYPGDLIFETAWKSCESLRHLTANWLTLLYNSCKSKRGSHIRIIYLFNIWNVPVIQVWKYIPDWSPPRFQIPNSKIFLFIYLFFGHLLLFWFFRRRLFLIQRYQIHVITFSSICYHLLFKNANFCHKKHTYFKQK